MILIDDDLISRKATAKRLLNERKHYDCHPNIGIGLDIARMIVEDYCPAVQPEIVRCNECKYYPKNPRPYADNDPIETFIHCQFMGADGFCSKGKRREE